MSECQDCNKKEATTIIFDMKRLMFYRVCDDCIGEDDKVCPFTEV